MSEVTATAQPRELVASFGDNIDAYMDWRDKVPPYLVNRLQHEESPGGEIRVFAKEGAITPFERKHLLSLLDQEVLTASGPSKAGDALPESLAAPARDPPPGEVNDPGPLPDELLSVPGFVNDYVDYQLATVPYPNRPLLFAGALTMLAHLSGRHHSSQEDLRTNLYVIALAESGSGKDQPRKVNQRLAKELNLMPTMADRFASAEGLEDALLLHPASFFQVDEVDTLFKSLQEKDPAMERIYGSVLQFFTTANGVYAPRKKALQSNGNRRNIYDSLRANGIESPHLVLLGTAVPEYFYRGLNERALASGLLSRCLVVEAHARGAKGTPHKASFPAHLLADAAHLAEHGCFRGVDLDSPETEPPPPILEEVPQTPEATALLERVADAADARHRASADIGAKTLWTRAAEKTMKLALLHAISGDVRHPVVSRKGVIWAWNIVEHTTRRTLFQAAQFMTENTFHEMRQKAIRYLREAGGRMRHGALLKRLHVDCETFRRLIETMGESGLLTSEAGDRGTVIYVLAA